MAVHIERLDRLQYRITFELAAQRIYAAVQERTRQLANQTPVPGFRRGKVTPAAVERILGPQVRQGVISELLMSTFQEVVAQESIYPAGSPRIEWVSPANPGSDEALRFVATFEVDPEFVTAPLQAIRLERLVARIDDALIDQRLATLQNQHATWREVLRPARESDRVILDMQGYLDDEPLYLLRKIPFVLGERNNLTGLETMAQGAISAALLGCQRGQLIALDIAFPDASSGPHEVPRTLHFDLRPQSVGERSVPALDDAFAASLGIVAGGMTALRAAIRHTLEEAAAVAASDLIKQQVLDALLALHPIEVPVARVEAEAERLLSAARRRMKKDRLRPEDLEIAEYLIWDKARNKVALELILSRIVASMGASELARLMTNFGPWPEGDSQDANALLARLSRPAQEGEQLLNTLVEWITAKAEVHEQLIPFEELMARWRRCTVSSDGDTDASRLPWAI